MDEVRKRICVSIPMTVIKDLEAIARYDARSSASLISKVLGIKAKKYLAKKAEKKTEKKTKKKRAHYVRDNY